MRNNSTAAGAFRRLATRWQAKSDYAQIFSRRLAALSIGNDIKRDLLSLVEVLHSRALDRADMYEDILTAVIGFDELRHLACLSI
jgi:hypothetical protein